MFYAECNYTDREGKSQYVYNKYQKILHGMILDAGADECYLKKYLNDRVEYTGIGLGGNPDLKINLEQESIPFPDKSFDVVICLDVLEHLDNLHDCFDQLCAVTKKYFILSLPNPLQCLWRRLRFGDFATDRMLKYYGLPLDKTDDRHKWFFNAVEAERFVRHRAKVNNMNVLQIDFEKYFSEGKRKRTIFYEKARNFLLHKHLDFKKLLAGTIWAVLEKNMSFKDDH